MSLVCVMMNTSHIKALSNKERSRCLHGSVKPRVKPRMDFPDQFSKIFLAYQPFLLESSKHLCPHALTANITS